MFPSQHPVGPASPWSFRSLSRFPLHPLMRRGYRVTPLAVTCVLMSTAFIRDGSAEAASVTAADQSSSKLDHGEKITVNAGPVYRAAASIDSGTRALQGVPRAATRIDSKVLRAEHITNLTQATRLLPSVQLNVSNPRNTTIDIRGLGASGTTPTDGIEGGVAVYVDGVYRPRPATALQDIADLDSITVLRGPTGTEGGMSATAGSISLDTALPSFSRHIYAEAGVGNYDYSRWRLGMTSGLYQDKLAFRLSATGVGNSGWVNNSFENGHYNGSTSRAVRAQLLYTPTDTLSVRISGDYSHLREGCCIGGLYVASTTRANGTTIPNNLSIISKRVGRTLTTSDGAAPYTVDINSLTSAEQEDMGLSSQVDWRLPDVTLSSITAYRLWNWYPNNDGDGLSVPVIVNNNAQVNETQFTQELRATGSFRHLVDYTAGAFYLWQENYVTGRMVLGPEAPTFYGVNNRLGNVALGGLQILNEAQPTTNDYATYGSAVWHVLPKFDVTTGLRYDYEAKTGSFRQSQTSASDLSSLTALQAAAALKLRNGLGRTTSYGGDVDNGFVTGRIVGQYYVTDAASLYASYARGAKSAGLNLVNLPVGAPTKVKQETDDSYEIGAKTTLLRGRLLLNAALFDIEDHDYQVSTVNAGTSSSTLLSYFGNAKAARSRGAELDAHFNPTTSWATSLSVAYDDAIYTSYHNAACPPAYGNRPVCDLTGSRLSFVPKWTLGASAQYSHGLDRLGLPGFIGLAGSSYTYKTAINSTTNNAEAGWVGGYGILNFNVGIKPKRGRWELDGFINNATDERHVTLVAQNGAVGGLFSALVTEPLNFGAILRIDL